MAIAPSYHLRPAIAFVASCRKRTKAEWCGCLPVPDGELGVLEWRPSGNGDHGHQSLANCKRPSLKELGPKSLDLRVSLGDRAQRNMAQYLDYAYRNQDGSICQMPIFNDYIETQ